MVADDDAKLGQGFRQSTEWSNGAVSKTVESP